MTCTYCYGHGVIVQHVYGEKRTVKCWKCRGSGTLGKKKE